MTKYRRAHFLPIVLTFSTATPGLAQISVIGWGFGDTVQDTGQGGGTASDSVNDLFLPNPFSLNGTTAATVGNSSGSTTYNFFGNGNIASFNFQMSETRAGSIQSFSGSGGGITFSVPSDLSYSLEGNYALSGSEQIRLFARITDQTTTDIIFDSLQLSLSTPNEEFTLGLEEGDNFNSLIGSTTGSLLAGHEYQFQYGYDIQILSGTPADGGASATGFLSFNITPEPTSAILLGLGGITMLRKRHRRTRVGG